MKKYNPRESKKQHGEYRSEAFKRALSPTYNLLPVRK